MNSLGIFSIFLIFFLLIIKCWLLFTCHFEFIIIHMILKSHSVSTLSSSIHFLKFKFNSYFYIYFHL